MKFLIALAVIIVLAVGIVLADNPHNLPAAPVIVAQSNNANQTSAIAPFTIFTPISDGNFRLSIYLETSSSSFNSSLCTSWGWTDDYVTHGGPPFNGDATDFFNIGISSNPQSGGFTSEFHAIAGSPITVGIFDNPSGGCSIPSSYGAFWTLEKL